MHINGYQRKMSNEVEMGQPFFMHTGHNEKLGLRLYVCACMVVCVESERRVLCYTFSRLRVGLLFFFFFLNSPNVVGLPCQ